MDESLLRTILRDHSIHLKAGLASRKQAVACDSKRTRPIRRATTLGKAFYHISNYIEGDLQKDARFHRAEYQVRPPRKVPQRVPEQEHLRQLRGCCQKTSPCKSRILWAQNAKRKANCMKRGVVSVE